MDEIPTKEGLIDFEIVIFKEGEFVIMGSKKQSGPLIEIHPLTSGRWPDFEELFGKHGAYGGCWCMWWRQSRREFEEKHGEKNRQEMKAIVQSGEVPGILCYEDGKPVGWCSVAPRDRFASLNRSPVLKRIDDIPVWSIVCFFVAAEHRQKGLIQQLLQGVIEYVHSQGGKVIEAYPTIPKGKQLAPVSVFMGTPSMFEKAGFVECSRPSKRKIIMRYNIE
jgi:GNAT superfamily N-acetyltransferase